MVPAPHSRNDSNYTVNEIYYSNGTLIEKLLIEDEDLTLEEREYFQDYEGQKEAYYNKKQITRRTACNLFFNENGIFWRIL